MKVSYGLLTIASVVAMLLSSEVCDAKALKVELQRHAKPSSASLL